MGPIDLKNGNGVTTRSTIDVKPTQSNISRLNGY